MTPQEIKQQAHTEFVKSFVKMSLTNRPTFYGIKFEDLDEVCYFIDSLIDRTVQMTEERVVGMIKKSRRIEPLYIGETQFRFYEGNVDWVYNGALDDLTNLITNKSEINK